jgi:hypothetical protein
MRQFHEGQCQCGSVTYRVTGLAATLFACHCTECQKQSSSAFGMALWIRHGEIELLSGELKHWVRELASGRHMRCSFCPVCGTRLFHRVEEQSEFMSIKPGTLNDTRWLVPVGHIWTRSKQTWLTLDPGSLQYDENPPSFEELLSAWHEP